MSSTELHIFSLPIELIFWIFRFLPNESLKSFSLCSKPCRSLAIRHIFHYTKITPDSLALFREGGNLHHIASTVRIIKFGIFRNKLADDICEYIRNCIDNPDLDVFTKVDTVKIIYSQISHPNTPNPARPDERLIKAIFRSLWKRSFYSNVRYIDFRPGFWQQYSWLGEIFSMVENEAIAEQWQISEENQQFLGSIFTDSSEEILKVETPENVAGALERVRFVKRRRDRLRHLPLRNEIDYFYVLPLMGGNPELLDLEWVEGINLVPEKQRESLPTHPSINEIWINIPMFQLDGYVEELSWRFPNVDTLVLLVTKSPARKLEYFVEPEGEVKLDWCKNVVKSLAKIKKLRRLVLPIRLEDTTLKVRVGERRPRRVDLGEYPDDITARLERIVRYMVEEGLESLKKVSFERRERNDATNSPLGPRWVCRILNSGRNRRFEWSEILS